MINQIKAASGRVHQPDFSQKAASKKQEKKDGTYDSAFSVELSATSRSEIKGGHALTTDELQSIKKQAEQSAAALKDVVEKLILRQGKNAPTFSGSLENHGTTGAVQPEQPAAVSPLSENDEWGINAVSDRIVSFAKSIAGGDPSKLELLREAIDKGFASAQKTLGGKLPDISMQTYDAVMSKLDDWAAESQPAAAE